MRRPLSCLTLLALLLLPFPALAAGESAIAPQVDSRPLPPLGPDWLTGNPYRQPTPGEALIASGREAYNQSCARCHGIDAGGSAPSNAAPAPDLRKLNSACRRIRDSELKARSMADNDAWFARSVRQGKLILGVSHMPAWEGVLAQELAWAIQLFIETQGRGGGQ